MHCLQNQTHSLRPIETFAFLEALGIPLIALYVHSLYHI